MKLALGSILFAALSASTALAQCNGGSGSPGGTAAPVGLAVVASNPVVAAGVGFGYGGYPSRGYMRYAVDQVQLQRQMQMLAYQRMHEAYEAEQLALDEEYEQDRQQRIETRKARREKELAKREAAKAKRLAVRGLAARK